MNSHKNLMVHSYSKILSLHHKEQIQKLLCGFSPCQLTACTVYPFISVKIFLQVDHLWYSQAQLITLKGHPWTE